MSVNLDNEVHNELHGTKSPIRFETSQTRALFDRHLGIVVCVVFEDGDGCADRFTGPGKCNGKPCGFNKPQTIQQSSYIVGSKDVWLTQRHEVAPILCKATSLTGISHCAHRMRLTSRIGPWPIFPTPKCRVIEAQCFPLAAASLAAAVADRVSFEISLHLRAYAFSRNLVSDASYRTERQRLLSSVQQIRRRLMLRMLHFQAQYISGSIIPDLNVDCFDQQVRYGQA